MKKSKITPRTFVKDTWICIPKRATVHPNGERFASCVYVCEQFMDYAVDKWGRRIIPLGATCPYCDNKACTGERVSCNGEIFGTIYRYNPVSKVFYNKNDGNSR